MENKISYITLAAHHWADMVDFYEKILGFEKMKTAAEMAVFRLENLHFCIVSEKLYLKELQISESNPFISNQLYSINVSTQAEVNAFFESLPAQYVRVAPVTTDWGGYRGYFADPENNFWEIVFNPHVAAP